MATSCFSIPLSSSNAIPKFKTLIPSSYNYIESLKPQFSSSSSISRSFLAKPLQIKVYSSNLSVLDEEIKGDGEIGEEEDPEMEMKKPRPCELYVCNLPRSYDIPQLLEMFQPFGTVISVKVSRNLETGQSRGSGYITMASINSAEKAMTSLDGTEVGGREMRVRYSVDMNRGTRRNQEVLTPTLKKVLTYESPYKVFVGNLPWSTQPDGLRQHFNGFGTIVSVKVVHDRKKRVFGFLSFANKQDRDAALSLNNTKYQGREIIVRECFENPKES